MYIPREEEVEIFRALTRKEATALIGPRRAGKTTIALKILDDWKKNGKPGLYFDLESLDAPTSAIELKKAIDKVSRGGLIVLDEVQVLDNWIKVVRDDVENAKHHVVVTGSNSSLLSKEIASSLGGRAIPEKILTLSYRDAKKWGVDSLEDYMKIGGYPECVLRPYDASKLHKLYLELTVLRDVATRRGIREIKPLSDLALLLLSEPGKMISAKKTASKLRISQPTFRSFVDALNDAFLVLSIPPFIRSQRERIVAEAKHYAYDIGMQRSVSISSEDDYERRLENLIAIELIRNDYSVSYIKTENMECDFIAQKFGCENVAIQVWSGDGTPPEREIEGLKIGMKQAKAKGLFLSKAKIETIPKNIETKTVERWMLGL